MSVNRLSLSRYLMPHTADHMILPTLCPSLEKPKLVHSNLESNLFTYFILLFFSEKTNFKLIFNKNRNFATDTCASDIRIK